MTTPDVPPKRLSLSQIVAMLIERSARDHSAVAISRSAAGSTQIEVTVRTGDDDTVATVEDAEKKAREVYDRLSEQYPPPNGHEQAEVTFTRNAKGETQVSVSAKTTAALPTLETLADSTRKVYDAARMKYPMADGHSAKAGSVS